MNKEKIKEIRRLLRKANEERRLELENFDDDAFEVNEYGEFVNLEEDESSSEED
ncbi:MAG: hypothetical protein GF349_00835 [Candidatus Magasanikbacteria bacterium]|nr:hypothetical protein [Candidatus Magasanikbacteria bacterium]